MRALLVIPLFVIASCGGSDEAALTSGGQTDTPSTSTEPSTTTTEPSTTTSTAATTTTTTEPATTTTIDALDRNQAVNEFIDAARAHFECGSGIECLAAQETYDRLSELRDLAVDIPGNDVRDRQLAINAALVEWEGCLGTAADRFECGSEEDALNEAVRNLYDALR